LASEVTKEGKNVNGYAKKGRKGGLLRPRGCLVHRDGTKREKKKRRKGKRTLWCGGGIEGVGVVVEVSGWGKNARGNKV